MAINLNSASQQELTQLPRNGADKARRIIHYLEMRKGFRDWADFACIPGIMKEDVEAIQTRAWIGPRMGAGGTPRRRTIRGPATARRPRYQHA